MGNKVKSVEILGYSERGMLNAVCDDLIHAAEPEAAISEFLSGITFASQANPPDFSGITHARLLVEQSFSAFGDLDLLILLDQGDRKQSVLLEAKVATDTLTPVTIKDHLEKFWEFLYVDPKRNTSSLFVQLYRKLRLIELLRLKQREFDRHEIWGHQRLGGNQVVLKASMQLAEYGGSPWFVGLVPDPREEVSRFVDQELRHFAPKDPDHLPDWSVDRFGFLTWQEIQERCRASPDRWPRTSACFEWNEGQVFGAPRADTRGALPEVGEVCQIDGRRVVVVGVGCVNCRVIPETDVGDYFAKSFKEATAKMLRTQRRQEGLDRRRPVVGQEYEWAPPSGESQPDGVSSHPSPPCTVRVLAAGWETCRIESTEGTASGAFHVYNHHLRQSLPAATV